MSKYIIKESELRAKILEAVKEELTDIITESFLGNVGRGAWNVAKNTAGLALKAGASPFWLAGDTLNKVNNIVNGNDTFSKTIGDFFGVDKMRSNSSSSYASKRDKTKTMQDNEKTILASLESIKKEYGEPQLEPGLNKRIKKRPLVVNDFLGTGQERDFGKHYFELNQDSEGSVWDNLLKKAQKGLSSMEDQRKAEMYMRKQERIIRRWLIARDNAYKQYMEIEKRKGRV